MGPSAPVEDAGPVQHLRRDGPVRPDEAGFSRRPAEIQQAVPIKIRELDDHRFESARVRRVDVGLQRVVRIADPLLVLLTEIPASEARVMG